MVETKEELSYIINVLIGTKDYKDALSYFDKLIDNYPSLSREDQENFVDTNKKIIRNNRNLIGEIRQILKDSTGNLSENKKKLLETVLNKNLEFVKGVCDRVIKTIDDKLISNTSDAYSQVFYLQAKGEFYRYMIEATGTEEYINKCVECYEKGQKLLHDIKSYSPTSLSFILSYCFFLYHTKNSNDALVIAKEHYEKNIGLVHENSNEDIDLAKEILERINLYITEWKQ